MNVANLFLGRVAALYPITYSLCATAAVFHKLAHAKPARRVVVFAPCHGIVIVCVEFTIFSDTTSARVEAVTAATLMEYGAFGAVPRAPRMYSFLHVRIGCERGAIDTWIILRTATNLVTPVLVAAVIGCALPCMVSIQLARAAYIILCVAADTPL